MDVGQRMVLGVIGGVTLLLSAGLGSLVLGPSGRRFARDGLSQLRSHGGSLGDPVGLGFGAVVLGVMGIGLIAYALAGA